jgi:CPA2 family monovalent cation:H+ antiporter-2
MGVMFAPLTQALILLAGSVFLVTLARRLTLPTSVAYLVVGLVLGPYGLGVISDSGVTRLLAELGVAFLLFTLGLEFSLPRMLAMRREVFGLGAAQLASTAGVFALIAHLLGIPWLVAIVLGGAVAMSSTALLLQQLTERAELNRTHGRLAFSMLLFQDLAFVPLFALGSALIAGQNELRARDSLLAVIGGALAIVAVLAAGRWLLRPLFHEITHSRLRELFTLAVLLVVLGSAWVSHSAGLPFALGAFLSGMMLAETEYRHQIDAAIRPFRDILLGLFFISVGMLLDVQLLARELGATLAMLLLLVVLKAIIAALVTRPFTTSRFKALRTGIVISIGGEFGVALCTLLLQAQLLPAGLGQPLVVAIVLSLVLSPLILNNNKRVARWLLREQAPVHTALEREDAATRGIAKREHVILCGFGRVGQNVARVLESQGFEYIALDLDPARIRAARQAGDPVVFGDSADEELLTKVGLHTASALVISFSDPATSLGILHSVRRLRPDVPVLVRTADDARLKELQDAGATDVVPETFEASLMLVSHVLMLLRVPESRVVRTLGEIRNDRYAVLRNIVRRADPQSLDETGEHHRGETKTVVVPPGAWAVGRSLSEVRERGVAASFSGVRRHGILGREPTGDTVLRDGDIVVLQGQPEDLERAEAILLAG